MKDCHRHNSLVAQTAPRRHQAFAEPPGYASIDELPPVEVPSVAITAMRLAACMYLAFGTHILVEEAEAAYLIMVASFGLKSFGFMA